MSRRLTLWHPDSPGMRVTVTVGLLRRLRLRRSEFATLGESIREHRRRDDRDAFARSFGIAA